MPYALYAKKAGNATETDPVYSARPSFSITNDKVTDLDANYSWGNHAGLYKSVSYSPAWGEIIANLFIFSPPTNNQMLRYNGTNWINFTPDFATATHLHSDATISVSGFMSNTDKTKLNDLQNVNITAGIGITLSGTYPNISISETAEHYTCIIALFVINLTLGLDDGFKLTAYSFL